MARDFYIAGENLVSVKGGAHMSGAAIGNTTELGLSVDPITITPNLNHTGITVDDYGPTVPVELMWQLASVDIKINLVHFDPVVLDICLGESMGGGATTRGITPPAFLEDTSFVGAGAFVAGAGRLMGGGFDLYTSGNHFISLGVTSTRPGGVNVYPWSWTFWSCYLIEKPMVFPLGVERSVVETNWRCIPYQPIYTSGKHITGQYSGQLPNANQSGVFKFDGIYYRPLEPLSSGHLLWSRDYLRDD